MLLLIPGESELPPRAAWLDSAPPCWDVDSIESRVSPTFVTCHFLQASPILEMSCFKLFEIHFIRFNKNSSVQDSNFGLLEAHLSCCVHKTGPVLMDVELTAPLTNETRRLLWIWCHGYAQACIPGEGAAPVKRRNASPRCVGSIGLISWFARSASLRGKLNQSCWIICLTQLCWHFIPPQMATAQHLLWIKILKKMSSVSSRYLAQTGRNACLPTTPPAARADLPLKLQIHFNTKCHRKVQTQVDAPVCITYSFFSALPFFLSAWMLKSIKPRRKISSESFGSAGNFRPGWDVADNSH